MFDKNEAERLFSYFLSKRAGVGGAHQFFLQAEVCEKLYGAKLVMVFVNTEGHSNSIKTDGNALAFELDGKAAAALHAGKKPEHLRFSKFSDFLNHL